METIEYTELWVRDGRACDAGGKIPQYWVAVNHITQTKTSATTYDGDIKGPININPYVVGSENQLRKKYTRITVNMTRIPKVFKELVAA